jgi:heterodisulfide reductase subunit A-like polyferredoxin
VIKIVENRMNRRDFLGKMLVISGSVGLLSIGVSSCSEIGNADFYIVDQVKCTGCEDCLPSCNFDAITISNKKAIISEDLCMGCGKCVSYCKHNAISA